MSAIARTLIAALVLVAFAEPGAAQLAGRETSGGCINVADVKAQVTATGRLTVGTFKDPYGTERAYILELPRAACIDDGDEFADPSEKFVQIHVTGANDRLLQILRRSVGRRITVSGNGFAAHTRHHRRPLVLVADRIKVR